MIDWMSGQFLMKCFVYSSKTIIFAENFEDKHENLYSRNW